MKTNALAAIAALISTGALNRKPSPAELDELRERCKNADHLLELGHYLHEARTGEEQAIVMEEIKRRGFGL